nr:hypothetical protein GCM10020063_019900 [Dactylosporangium thailandense]
MSASAIAARPEASLARIMRDGRSVGLAFVIGDRHLVTNAHVVNAALARGAVEPSAPGAARLLLEFPFGGQRDDVPIRYATVAMWGPSHGSFLRHDVAGLTLLDALPHGVRALAIARGNVRDGAPVQILGPGRGENPAALAHVAGELMGAIDGSRYQLDQRLSGVFRARRGFSGGPVWHRDTGEVVGLLASASADDGGTDAYLVGIEVAADCWPEVLYRPPPCPYRGLEAFGVDDAARFFGREPVVADLLQRAGELPLIAVTGRSGSGKSSVIAAGLVAALRAQERVAVLTVRPGGGVIDALATGLATHTSSVTPVPAVDLEAWEERLAAHGLPHALATLRRSTGADRGVIVLDQFEQIFADRHPAGQRRRILDQLAELAAAERTGGDLVALSVRHDFFGPLIEANRALGPYLQRHATMLYPPTEAQLRSAVVQPALLADPDHPVAVEPALVDQILLDFSGQAGELPLVQFALTRLWQLHRRPVLTLGTYAALGGVRRALTAFADRYVDELPTHEADAARRIFCRLGMSDGFGVGRRLLRTELPATDWQVVQRLADHAARLVVLGCDSVTGVETVEIAHEVLLRAWPRLREWLEADRKFLEWLRATESAETLWEEHRYDERLLLRDPLLEQAETLLGQRPEEVAHLRGFIESSRQAARSERFRLQAETVLRPIRPEVGSLSIAARYIVAASAADAGRGFYEAVDTSWGVRMLVGHVSGAGRDAFGVVAHILGTFRHVAHERADLRALAADLDRAACRVLDDEQRVPVLVAEARGGMLAVVNCGHAPPLLLRRGEVFELDPPQAAPPLGFLPVAPIRVERLDFGDRMLLYSGALRSTRPGGEEFPLRERAWRLVGHGAVADGVASLESALTDWTGADLAGDVALLLSEYRSGAVGSQRGAPRWELASSDRPDGAAG